MGVTRMSGSSIVEFEKSNKVSGKQTGRPVSATGGTIATQNFTSGTYQLHTFTFNGTFTIDKNAVIEFVCVAGGGGGGSGGGGGGGGGFVSGTVFVESGSYAITVGAGGPQTTQGVDSSIGSLIVSAGGGAGGFGPGGSGGGANNNSGAGGAGNTPTIAPSQGFNGGTAQTGVQEGRGGAGGGGGAGSTGGGGTGGGTSGTQVAGGGGAGRVTTISGDSVIYAGGGGGRNTTTTSGGGGGAGGGGLGQTTGRSSTAGADNTGGGGGGGVSGSQLGGSGIVLIRFQVVE